MIYIQILKEECLFQHKTNWSIGGSNRHYKSLFEDKDTANFRDVISVNLYSRKFVFKFLSNFNDFVNEKNDVFNRAGLLKAFHIACCFKVMTRYISFSSEFVCILTWIYFDNSILGCWWLLEGLFMANTQFCSSI